MGLDSAEENNVVLIAPGTYFENVRWPENIKGINLIGELGSASTIIDGNEEGRVLEKDLSSDPNSMIKGITLRNGKALFAAGLYIDGRGTVLDDVIVTANETSGEIHCDGGGAKLESYSGIIRNCRFTSNRGNGGWTSYGAGLSIELSGSLEMNNVVISGNRSKGGNSSSSAGLAIDGFSNTITMTNVRVTGNINLHDTYGFTPGARIGAKNITIDSCRFTGNSNGGATSSVGGGLSLRSDNGVIKNSLIASNYSEKGAGLRFYNDDNNITITNTSISDNGGSSAVHIDCENSEIYFENCMIVNNGGYGIQMDTPLSDDANYVNLNHVTIANNDKAIHLTKGWFDITNSIMWNFISENDSEFWITAGGWIVLKSSIVRNGFQGSLVLDVDPLLDPVSFEPGYQSMAANFANPIFSPPSSFNNVPRPTPSNTLPDIGAFETNQARSFVDVRFFFDDNKNGIVDPTDFNISIGGINYNDVHYPNIKEEGISLELPFGNNVITYEDLRHTFWELTTNAIVTENVVDSVFYKEVLFGLSPRQDTTHLESFVIMDPFRCGEVIDGTISVFNEFSVIDNSYLWLEVDDRIETILFETEPDITMSNNIFGWELTDFKPTFTEAFDFNLIVPEISGQNELGDVYNFKAWCEGFEESSEYIYSPELRCSYDPNDKMAIPTEIESDEVRDASISYTIRFQNTGNDYAKDVVILDTLSDNVIPESFQYVSSSHPDHLRITRESNHILRFHFANIFLIDSLHNPELSHGFVSFKVSPLPSLEVDSEINNIASIYFDSNPAIVTNTVETKITAETSSGMEEILRDRLKLFPNPTSGIIIFDRVVEYISVYSLDGKLMMQDRDKSSIDIQSLESGVYMLNLKVEGISLSRKVVKQ
jgi:uncharacterized repeat protein (TIGR01451 family)